MANPFPYYRWFTSDARADEKFSALSDQQRGFMHRCLDHSWDNDGLPGDLDQLAETFRVTRKYLDKLWPKVSACGWELTETVRPRWINRRQEKEREYARTKSESATRAVRTRYGRSDSVEPRAYGSDSDSGSSLEVSSGKSVHVVKLTVASSQRFEEWWTLWSAIRGTNHRLQAAQAWLSVATVTLEIAVFECTRSYLQSLDNPAKGYNPDNFLFEQAKDQFSARWPARASPDATTAERRRAETIAGMKVIEQIRRSGDVR